MEDRACLARVPRYPAGAIGAIDPIGNAAHNAPPAPIVGADPHSHPYSRVEEHTMHVWMQMEKVLATTVTVTLTPTSEFHPVICIGCANTVTNGLTL